MKGKGKGTPFSDRKLAGDVRNLALGHLKRILDPKYKDKDLQNKILERLAPNLLPRQTEITGGEGEALFPTPIYGGISTKS